MEQDAIRCLRFTCDEIEIIFLPAHPQVLWTALSEIEIAIQASGTPVPCRTLDETEIVSQYRQSTISVTYT